MHGTMNEYRLVPRRLRLAMPYHASQGDWRTAVIQPLRRAASRLMGRLLRAATAP
jgi:hypothetical protein